MTGRAGRLNPAGLAENFEAGGKLSATRPPSGQIFKEGAMTASRRSAPSKESCLPGQQGSPGSADDGIGDDESTVLLGTKLAAPWIRARLVHRPTLSERLAAQPDRKLTLLSAPAGWGKTTLLAQWMSNAEPNQSFGWLSLDGSDNDPTRFWACIFTALRKANPKFSSRALEFLGMGADLTQVVLPTALNELTALDEQIVLILDDYHVVRNPTVHEQMTFVIDRMPETLRLVLATRSDPPLPLARMRGRGEVVELRTDDLRFVVVETADLLTGTLGLELTHADVQLLHRRTEGWVAGLCLAALSLSGRADTSRFIRAFAGDNRHIVDFLIDEVLTGHTAQRRNFLLSTSILPRLNGALCDAVLRVDRH